MSFIEKGSGSESLVAFSCLMSSLIHSGIVPQFFFVFIILTLWKIIGELFFRMFLNLVVQHLMIRFRLCIFGRNSIEAMIPFSHCILSGGARFQTFPPSTDNVHFRHLIKVVSARL